MATIEVFRTEKMVEIENSVVVGADLDENGNLTLTLHDGTTIDAGNIKGPVGDAGSYPQADDSNFGLALLATSDDVAEGTDASKALTPASLKPNLPAPPYLARVEKNIAVQTNIPNPFSFTSIIFDPDSMWDTSNSWFTAPVDGYYNINGQIRQSTAVGFTVEAYIIPAASSDANEFAMGPNAKAVVNSASVVSTTVPLHAGDHVQLRCRGTNVTNTATGLDNFFEIAYVRPL